jgi:glycosyltransferase involved in cell wall biosynthesis
VLTGTVPDMREQIASAAVCVVPLRIGSGTRLKILEAAAMAKPIVSTHLGAEGLDFVAGQEIILVDKPDAFARAVAGLLADAGARRALGQAARRRVERSYNFPVLRSAVRDALGALGPNPRSDRPTPAEVRVEAY